MLCHLPSGLKESKGVQELRLVEMEIRGKLLSLWQAHSVASFYHSRFCEAVDKPESDAKSEDDPLLILLNSRDIVKLIDLDCACVLRHYLNRHLYFNN